MGEAKFEFNLGAATFATFSILSLLVCLAKGIVPIYFFEAIFWAGLAWFWKSRNITGQKANLSILVIALVVAAGEGYGVGYQMGFMKASDAFEKYRASSSKPHDPYAEFKSTPVPPPGFVLDRPASSGSAEPESPKPPPLRIKADATAPKKLSCPTGLPSAIVPTALEDSDLAKVRGTLREGWFSFSNSTDICIVSVTIQELYDRPDKEPWSFELKLSEPLAPGHSSRSDYPVGGGSPSSWKIVKAMGFPASTN